MELLTLDGLKKAAAEFLERLDSTPISELYGTTDGKAVGTYVEHAFHAFLGGQYAYGPGSSASGIDFPELEVDLKVTSVTQPQSSCPFTAASQKVYGLGYHLLVFVYEKSDDHNERAARLIFRHGIFISKESTADYQTTVGLLGIITRGGNIDDVDGFLQERNLPLDEIGRRELAERIIRNPPRPGVMTISNALQWRLQYGRAIVQAGHSAGVERLR